MLLCNLLAYYDHERKYLYIQALEALSAVHVGLYDLEATVLIAYPDEENTVIIYQHTMG